MIVFRLSKNIYANDLTGKGAEIYGGRWNSVGTPMIYTAESRALCAVEIAVNTPLSNIPTDYSIISFRNQFGVNTIDQTRISDGSLFLSKIKTNVINNREYQYFTHQTLNSQLDGEHQIRIKNYKFGFNWSTNFNDVSRNAPDNRLIQSSKSYSKF